MSGLDIEAIRGRARIAASVADALPPIGQEAVAATVDAVGALIDALAEEQTVQLDRYARLEARLETETKHLRAELDHQRRRADAAEADLNVMKSTEDGEAVVLRCERDRARAALAEALQVIADLRGESL